MSACLPAARAAGVRGTLAGEMHWSGTLQQPAFDGKVELAQLTIGDGSPLAIDAEGGYAGGELRARISLGDEHGALASAGAEMQLDWGALKADPDTLAAGAFARTMAALRRQHASAASIACRCRSPSSRPTRRARHALRSAQAGRRDLGLVSFTSRWDAPVVTEGCAASAHALARGRSRARSGHARARRW